MSWNDTVIEQFRAGEPRIANTFDRDYLVLLHTTGAKSGEPRMHPVAGFAHGDDLVVIASKGGAPTHPAWYHNLVANPSVRVERWVDDRLESVDATARTAQGEERDRLWAQITAHSPGFADYQTKTDREIPVVVLEPTPQK